MSVRQRVCAQLLTEWPALLAIWAFGSRITGHANGDSDLDLAVLFPGRAEPLKLWEAGNRLAQQLGHDVDLLDLRAASTVMAHQVISSGECWYAVEPQAGSWAAFALNEKLRLDETRAPLLAQIEQEGSVHGR